MAPVILFLHKVPPVEVRISLNPKQVTWRVYSILSAIFTRERVSSRSLAAASIMPVTVKFVFYKVVAEVIVCTQLRRKQVGWTSLPFASSSVATPLTNAITNPRTQAQGVEKYFKRPY